MYTHIWLHPQQANLVLDGRLRALPCETRPFSLFFAITRSDDRDKANMTLSYTSVKQTLQVTIPGRVAVGSQATHCTQLRGYCCFYSTSKDDAKSIMKRALVAPLFCPCRPAVRAGASRKETSLKSRLPGVIELRRLETAAVSSTWPGDSPPTCKNSYVYKMATWCHRLKRKKGTLLFLANCVVIVVLGVGIVCRMHVSFITWLSAFTNLDKHVASPRSVVKRVTRPNCIRIKQ